MKHTCRFVNFHLSTAFWHCWSSNRNNILPV